MQFISKVKLLKGKGVGGGGGGEAATFKEAKGYFLRKQNNKPHF